MSAAPFAQLHAFLVVARQRSFAGAARELGVTRSAMSQAVRQLEDQLRVTLLVRTTRSVSLTDAGRRLVESAAPALAMTVSALNDVSSQPGAATGRLRLSVPHDAVASVIEPVVPAFRARFPRIEVEVAVEERLVDIVAEGYDAGVRLSDIIQRDMVQVKLTDAFRFVVVGAPSYLKKHGVPEKPDDLLRHECITFRSQTTRALYAWELERGRKRYRVPVRGGVVTNDGRLAVSLAAEGLGLAYTPEPAAAALISKGKLKVVLEAYAASVPGYYLYFPTRSQRATPLRLFIETARELSIRDWKAA